MRIRRAWTGKALLPWAIALVGLALPAAAGPGFFRAAPHPVYERVSRPVEMRPIGERPIWDRDTAPKGASDYGLEKLNARGWGRDSLSAGSFNHADDRAAEHLDIGTDEEANRPEAIKRRLSESTAANIFVSSPKAVEPARRFLSERGEKGRLVVYKRTNNSAEAALAAMAAPVSRLETIVSLPASADEAVVIHGTLANEVPPRYWDEQRTAFEHELSRETTVDVRKLTSTDQSAAEALKARLGSSDADLIVVVAENRGGALRFADGSAFPTAEVERPNGKLVAILGCTSARNAMPQSGTVILGTGRQITYRQALNVAKVFDTKARARKPFTTRDLLLHFQNSTQHAEKSMVGIAMLQIGITRGAVMLDAVV